MSDETVPLENYTAALDEIYALRRALAYEARVVEAHLDYKTFPKSRREIAIEQVGRMRLAVKHSPWLAYAAQSSRSMDTEYSQVMRKRIGDATMTRQEWETQRGLR